MPKPIFVISGVVAALLVAGISIYVLMQRGDKTTPEEQEEVTLPTTPLPSEEMMLDEETLEPIQEETPTSPSAQPSPSEGTPTTPPPTQEQPPAPPPPQTVSYIVEADDSGLYPSSISVPKGATVNLTFKVRSTNVYYGGLDFRSSKFNTTAVPPGGQTTVTFTADATFSYASYWPASGVKKADGTVVVQ